MLKDITLGRYYNTSSPLHSLDPRTKLAFTVVFVASLFLYDSVIGYLLATLVLITAIALSKVPLSFMFKGFRAIISIVVITDIINIVSSPKGWINAILITIRIMEIVVASNLLSLTTRPKDIADGLESSLGFLKAVKIPVHDFATMISIAVRFIPILTSEADRIMQAQKARGACFDQKNLVKKAKAIAPIIIPLFVSAFRRADNMALAMDSRLYGAGKATRLHPLVYSKNDRLAYVFIIVYLLLSVLMRFLCRL